MVGQIITKIMLFDGEKLYFLPVGQSQEKMIDFESIVYIRPISYDEQAMLYSEEARFLIVYDESYGDPEISDRTS